VRERENVAYLTFTDDIVKLVFGSHTIYISILHNCDIYL